MEGRSIVVSAFRLRRVIAGVDRRARPRLISAFDVSTAARLRPVLALGLLGWLLVASPLVGKVEDNRPEAEARLPELAVPSPSAFEGRPTPRSPGSSLSGPPTYGGNPIQAENQAPGAFEWSTGLFPPTKAIQGYTSEVSVLPADSLDLHVSLAPAATYRIDLYRLGWYGGVGARLMACVAGCDAGKPGAELPIPASDPTTGEIDADWPVTDSFRIPGGWPSGYYMAKLVVTSGPQTGQANGVPFIVRDSPSRLSPSAILVQASVNTWEAYNNWGGKSIYAYNSSRRSPATKVSFDRPYAEPDYLAWEYQLVRFLEREGFDVSYTTDVDTDRDPGDLLRHRLVIVSGHDEYWSREMRDAFDAAKSAGVNLAFIGANIGYWQIRYENNRRTIVEYRDAQLDPQQDSSLKTVTFQSLAEPQPECELLGIQYQGGLRGDYARPTDYAVDAASLGDPWFVETGFTAGSTLRDLVGYEWDGVQPGCRTPQLTVLFHATGPPDADAVRYVAPSGAQVFSSGSLQFAWGLDDWGAVGGSHADPRLQRFMRNALQDLSQAGPDESRARPGF